MNSSGEGRTIIEALEGYIGRDFSSDFGIVLMTADDLGYYKRSVGMGGSLQACREPRPRPGPAGLFVTPRLRTAGCHSRAALSALAPPAEGPVAPVPA
jgi:hypothetical protein